MRQTLRDTIAISLVGALAALALPAAGQSIAPKLQQPILLTSCGQSPGAGMLSVILRKVGLSYDLSPLASIADLKAKPYKCLIIVMGASLKGMGAAGIAIDDEIKRAADLIGEARKMKITLIGAHETPGPGRRGRRHDRRAVDRRRGPPVRHPVRLEGRQFGRTVHGHRRTEKTPLDRVRKATRHGQGDGEAV
jgi:hypothetical protein